MDIKNFDPYVRFCSEVHISSSYQRSAKAYDYRLFYVISGGFTAIFPDKRIEMSAGSVLIFPPGTEYKMELDKYKFSNHIIVNFDFVTDNYGSKTKTLDESVYFREEAIYSKECLADYADIFHLAGAEFCKDILFSMCIEMKKEREHYLEIVSADMKKLLIRIIRETKGTRVTIVSSGETLCERIKEYIEKEFSSPLTNRSIAKKFGYHAYYINAIFKKNTGMTIHSYIVSMRLNYARDLLLTTEMTVAEIGANCGFMGASYFSECFSEKLGITPTEYRENGR